MVLILCLLFRPINFRKKSHILVITRHIKSFSKGYTLSRLKQCRNLLWLQAVIVKIQRICKLLIRNVEGRVGLYIFNHLNGVGD